VRTFAVEFKDVDRAVLDGEAEGLLKVHVKGGSDEILGATIVARHAGDMIGELSLAMSAGLGLKAVGRAIQPYPTQAECLRKAADACNRARLTPGVRGALERWLRWTR